MGRKWHMPFVATLFICAAQMLPACSQNFDEDFADAEKELEDQAKELDKELSEQMESELGEQDAAK